MTKSKAQAVTITITPDFFRTVRDNTHILYRCYSDSDLLLYVGMTNNPENRFSDHRRDSKLGGVMTAPRCQDCNQLVAEKQDLRDKLRGAYAVIAERQQRLEDDERNIRAARRQLELFMDDGITERVTVALALLDESVKSRNEAWLDFTEQRGQ